MKLSELYEIWRIINKQIKMLDVVSSEWGIDKDWKERCENLKKLSEKIYKICEEAEKQPTKLGFFYIEKDYEKN